MICIKKVLPPGDKGDGRGGRKKKEKKQGLTRKVMEIKHYRERKVRGVNEITFPRSD